MRRLTYSNASNSNVSPQGGDISYERTRDGFIGGLKVVKAASETTSLLGPLKAVCEMSLLFLETLRSINENTKGLKQLRDGLLEHVAILDTEYTKVTEDAQKGPMPNALKDFQHALKDYVDGLKEILVKIDELSRNREKGLRGLQKFADARIEPGTIADYKQQIEQCTRTFEDKTKQCQMQLGIDGWKMTRLGPEKPRPMGTQHKPCLPGTREPILQEIRRWHLDPNPDERVFWLCDEPGSGKSTVAATMCEEWDNAQAVFGRFFFSKNARQTSETDAFCSVVAEDIGSKNEVVMECVRNAKQKDTQLLERGLRYQFIKLVEEPLHFADADVIVVVDAIDECDKEMRGELLRLLVEKIPTLPKLKLFITSRPEPDIAALLQSRAIVSGMHFKMHGKEDRSNVNDIKAYVDAHLTKLLNPADRQQLVERSNGLFIWITTAHLELEQAQDPHAIDTTLKTLLNRGEGEDLNQVYANILRRVIRERSLEVIRKVIGTILTLFEPVSTEALARLTDITHPQLEKILLSMESVFRVGSVIEFLHPTFREYLVSTSNTIMPLEVTTVQSNLAVSVLRVLQGELKEDICAIRQPDEAHPNNRDILDLDERLQQLWDKFPALSYSVRYWGSHVAPFVTNRSVTKELRMLLTTHILHLIELLSLMGQIHLFRSFQEVRKGFESQRLDATGFELCHDVIRTVQRHQKMLEESALHIYSSAMLFLPRKTRLWTTYASKFSHRIPKIVGPLSEHWPSHRVLAGHENGTTCVAISPDGTLMVSGSDDKTLRLWDANTGVSTGELKGHTKAVTCVAFLPHGLRIASGSWDKTLRLWDATTSTCIGELKGHNKAVLCLGFSPDGRLIASGSQDTTLRLWDAMTGESIAELNGHTKEVTCLAFSSAGHHIASGSRDATVRLWDATTGLNIGELKGHNDAITSLMFSPNGLLASGSRDTTLRLWNITDGVNVGELKGHVEAVTCLSFSPNGLLLVSGSRDATLRLWDVGTGGSIGEMRGHTKAVTCLLFLPDGLRIVSGSDDKTLRLWDVEGKASVTELKGHTSGVTCLAFSRDTLHIASGSWDKTLRLWDVTSSGTGDTRGHTDVVTCLEFSPDGRRVVSGSYDKTLQMWDAVTGAHIAELKGHTGKIACAIFSPDGLYLVSGSDDKTLRLWAVATASGLGSPYPLNAYANSLRFAEDGRTIQVNNRMVFDISQGRLQLLISLTHTITFPEPPESEISIDAHSNELWCLSHPQRRYRFPEEFRWLAFTKHQNKVAFGMRNGQVIAIHFTNAADS